MKLILLACGKTQPADLEPLIGDFEKRIRRYLPFEIIYTRDQKFKGNTDPDFIRQKEGELLLGYLHPQDRVWILDEKGRQFSSRGFARRLQKAMNSGPKRLVFLIGGAYGFSPEVRERADFSLSLSEMTFNHQVVRLMAAEQLYRGLSILKGDPYHND